MSTKKGKAKPMPTTTIEWVIEEWPLTCSNCGESKEGGMLSIHRGTMDLQVCIDCLTKVLEGVFTRGGRER